MKRLILLTLALCSTAALGQTTTTSGSTSGATSGANANSQSGIMDNQMGQAAQMHMGNITFGDSQVPDNQRVHTTPTIYTAPSVFGGSNNCGMSNTMSVGVTGFGIGGSMASESVACNAREDTATAYRLGYQEVAVVRFFCFGEEANKLAYEASGRTCPDISLLAGRTTPSVGNGAETVPVQEPRVPEATEPPAGTDTSRAEPLPSVDVAAIVVAGFVDMNRDVYGNLVSTPKAAPKTVANAASKPGKSKASKAKSKVADQAPVGSLSVTETAVPAFVAATDNGGDDAVMTVDVTDPLHAVSSIDPTQIVALASVDTNLLVDINANAGNNGVRKAQK